MAVLTASRWRSTLILLAAALAHSDLALSLQKLPAPCDGRAPAALRALGNTGGFGNRVGWWLSLAALGEALHKPVYTFWPDINEGTCSGPRSVQRGTHRGYSHEAIRRAVQWPASLRFLEDSVEFAAVRELLDRGIMVSASKLDYSAWDSPPHGFAKEADVWKADLRIANMSSTLALFEAKEALFGTLCAAELPFPSTRPYLNDLTPEPSFALWSDYHRHGSRKWRAALDGWERVTRERYLEAYWTAQRTLVPRNADGLCMPAPRRSYVVLHLRRGDRGGPSHVPEETIGVLREVYRRTGLPWLVLSDDSDARRIAEQALVGADLGLVHDDTQDDCTMAWPLRERETLLVLRDFFSLKSAAGVVVSMTSWPMESSFSTVSALAGGAALLFPVARRAHPVARRWEDDANNGKPMRGVFFLDDLGAFSRAVREPYVLITEDGILQRACDFAFHTRKRHDLSAADQVNTATLGTAARPVICACGDADIVAAFFETIAPAITVPFTLVTLESDWRVPQDISYINSQPFLVMWWGWNTALAHQPKLRPLPIGINADRNAAALLKARATRRPQRMRAPGHRLLVNFRLDRPERRDLWALAGNWGVFAERVPYNATLGSAGYYNLLSSGFSFVVCPQGEGEDTHRVWEALYLGVRPIVRSGPNSAVYEGLPVVIVDSWAQIDAALLERIDQNHHFDSYDELPSLDLDTWVRRVRDQAQDSSKRSREEL